MVPDSVHKAVVTMAPGRRSRLGDYLSAQFGPSRMAIAKGVYAKKKEFRQNEI
jgi:hypothetical protein